MEPPPAQLKELDPNEPVTLSSLIKNIISNYGTYFETKEKLLGLQEWVREQEKLNPAD